MTIRFLYFRETTRQLLFDFRNNIYWVSLFQRNNSLIFRTRVSCFSVTLFYSILLALTHRQNHRQRNEYTRFAWAGGTFFPVVLLFQFFVLAGNRFWFYILLMYLGYHTVVVLCQFFLVLVGNGFWCYVRTQCTIQLCGCVSFFVVAGKLILYEYLTVTIISQKY